MILNVAGHEIDLDVGDGVVTDVIVLARVQQADSPGSDIAAGVTEHSDYITKLGLMHYALDVMRQAKTYENEDGEWDM